MKQDREIFKPIPGYEDYAVSNYGNVKSLQRKVRLRNTYRIVKERILKPGIDSNGYYLVNLFSNNNQKTFRIHKLVAITFLNHVPNGYKLIVDHIDNNPLNNRLDNLQLVSQRENSSKDKFRKKTSSKYVGVTLHKQKYKRVDGTIKVYQRWKASIRINDKREHLGYFKTQEEANQAYQNKLEEINNK